MDLNTVLVSGVVGLVSSVITAYVTSRFHRRDDRRGWERNVALRIAEAHTDRGAADALAHQFACGALIVQRSETGRPQGLPPPSAPIRFPNSTDNELTL